MIDSGMDNVRHRDGESVIPGSPARRWEGRPWEEIKTEVTEWAGDFLCKRRLEIRERHRHGASGIETVHALTGAMDDLLRVLFQLIGEASGPYIRHPCALLALGGYGRRDLSPNSDVDLLLLHRRKSTPCLETLAARILHALWDIGLEVGHSIRTVRECVALAGKDPRVKSSLIDGRFVCGDRSIYLEFAADLRNRILERGRNRFIKEKLEELARRHNRCGGSVYVLEPYIKDGVGGLRDIHVALWIAKVKCTARDLNELKQKGMITAREAKLVSAAQEFLLRVRNELHFQVGKHQDQLSFDLQESISRGLGFRDTQRARAVEAFMKVYYLHSATIWQLTGQWIQRMVRPSATQRLAGKKGRKIGEGVRLYRHVLSVRSPSVIRRDPAMLISIFAQAQRHKAEISDRTKEMIRQNLFLINDALRRSTHANFHFFSILKWKERVYETLLEMHRLRVLDRFIPEFGQLLCLVQHDLYHIYTVDEHSLMGIRELERLKTGLYKEESLLLTQVIREIEKIEILYLGMMFHDIGKGHGKGHSEIGADMVRKIARRMHLNQDDVEVLIFLVRHHLLMSHLAQRRDTEDEKLIGEFAGQVETRDRLQKLYLLTFADIKAVGPDVWSRWKGSLLSDLYLRALEVLDHGVVGDAAASEKVARIEARVSRRLPLDLQPSVGKSLMRLLPDVYFLTTPEEDIPDHLSLMAQFHNRLYVSNLRHCPEKEYTEFAICTLDRPGLFSQITGVFASQNLDILHARITTRKDGVAFDVFRISHQGRKEGILDPGLWDRVRKDVEKVLAGEADIEMLVQKARQPTVLRKPTVRWVPTEVLIDNGVSDRFTVLDVYTRDRVGVLYTITRALHRLDVSIHLAKISTNVNQIADVFYITDLDGDKIQSAERLERIKRTLTELLSEGVPFQAREPAYREAEADRGIEAH